MNDVTLVEQDWIGLVIFNNFADQDWIRCNFIGSGLDSDCKISQSAHLCFIVNFFQQSGSSNLPLHCWYAALFVVRNGICVCCVG